MSRAAGTRVGGLVFGGVALVLPVAAAGRGAGHLTDLLGLGAAGAVCGAIFGGLVGMIYGMKGGETKKTAKPEGPTLGWPQEV